MDAFKGRDFQKEIILWAVRWYYKYGISYRELEEMLLERGVQIDHTTIYRWVQRYAPEIEKRLRWYRRHPGSCSSWCIDEIYVKMSGRWTYLYRAVDKRGYTLDFYLSSRRNAKAATRFLCKALKELKSWQMPHVLNTDEAGSYTNAITEFKKQGECPDEVKHRQVKYLNNVTECDHDKLKWVINLMLGVKSLKTAYDTIKVIEVMRALRKGQVLWPSSRRGTSGEPDLRLLTLKYIHPAGKFNSHLPFATVLIHVGALDRKAPYGSILAPLAGDRQWSICLQSIGPCLNILVSDNVIGIDIS